ncbi:MAG: hypothetical protein IPJ06_14435 [Saprospiraceae bacterium]|nr:hypothetical protein [Saprospiraceae bacterium]
MGPSGMSELQTLGGSMFTGQCIHTCCTMDLQACTGLLRGCNNLTPGRTRNAGCPDPDMATTIHEVRAIVWALTPSPP